MTASSVGSLTRNYKIEYNLTDSWRDYFLLGNSNLIYVGNDINTDIAEENIACSSAWVCQPANCQSQEK